jgi:hypothetical protein
VTDDAPFQKSTDDRPYQALFIRSTDSDPQTTHVAIRYGSLENWAFSRLVDSVRISMRTS